MSSAVYGRVTAIKAFPSTGNARVEIEIPVGSYVPAVNMIYDRDVLITLAPAMGGAYGVVSSNAPAPAKPEVAKPEAEAKPKVVAHHEQKLSTWAALRCKDPQFQAWVADVFDKYGAYHNTGSDDEAIAKMFVCETCGIVSRAELDTQPTAEKRFHELIRQPFAEWCNV